MSELLVSAFTPDVASGQGLRTYGVARALAALGPVELLYVPFGGDRPAAEYENVSGLSLRRVESGRGAGRLLAYGRALAAGVPDGFARGASAELAHAVEDRFRAIGAGRVIADGPVAAAALLPLFGRHAVVYNAHNLESAFRHRIAAMNRRSRRRLERFERGLIERAAETWMASPADVDAARALAPGATIRYVPNVVDVARIGPAQPSGGGERVLFVGDFRYPPNVDGLRYLTGEVMPRLWRELPGARLSVVGRGLESSPSEDPRVEHRGFVPTLASVYSEADCVAIPLLAGGGSPLKFVEALAYGSAVIATPIAAAGLEATPDVHYLEGADAAGFARSIARVLRGGRPDLGARARALAESAYSIESLSARLAQR